MKHLGSASPLIGFLVGMATHAVFDTYHWSAWIGVPLSIAIAGTLGLAVQRAGKEG